MHFSTKEMDMSFDWHAGPITRATPIDTRYRNTQKVRQFLVSECGGAFRSDDVVAQFGR
ncbi:DUF6434 domain-containing protein [Pantoea sp. Tr-811]|uniref:DUF6434 domain-containing protein n=1 Tax=Pantoea sp. Tr-811 TaxID=2608361 RepID=UPI00141E4B94|nr:DUF6434 domain-containing protein [Pantoea sp. Tr-811]